MKRRARLAAPLALVSALLLAAAPAGTAFADDDDLPPAPLPGAAAPAPAELEARYQTAFDLLVADEVAEALTLLRAIAAEARGTDLEIRAETLLELAEARSGHLALERPPLLAAAREGRFNFVTWTTLGSIATGIKLGILLDVFDPRANVLLVMATTGTGLAASLLATRDFPVTVGSASLYRTGLIAGSWAAFHIGNIADIPGQTTAGVMILGSALGGTTGVLAGRATSVAPGPAALVGSSFLWGSVTGLLMLPIFEPDDFRVASAIMLAGSVAGLGAGATAASRVDISRTRVLLMDLGALVGGLTLGGLGIVLFIDQPAAWVPRVVPSMAIAGILAGGSISLWLTRGLDAPEGGGGGLGTHGGLVGREAGRWSLGVPAPAVMPAARDGEMPGIGLSLVAGEL